MTHAVLQGCWCRCWWQVFLSALPQLALKGLTSTPQDSLGAATDRRITSTSSNHALLRPPLPMQSRAWAIKPVQVHVQGVVLSIVRVPLHCASQHEPASIMLRRAGAFGSSLRSSSARLAAGTHLCCLLQGRARRCPEGLWHAQSTTASSAARCHPGSNGPAHKRPAFGCCSWTGLLTETGCRTMPNEDNCATYTRPQILGHDILSHPSSSLSAPRGCPRTWNPRLQTRHS